MINNEFVLKCEEKIRTHLLENYLENENVRFTIGLSDVPIRFSNRLTVINM